MQNYIGQHIERYRITERLGEGGMAVVYKAYDTRLERNVALKLIRTEAIPQERHNRLMQRFEHEAKAQAGFSHPNIVPVYDYGVEQGLPYLVMKYLAGGTLKEKLTGPLPSQQALRWLIPIASALSYAHEVGVVHRGVKPSNIIFDQEERPILTDFGIAKILETTDISLTGTGLGVGTPEYMAPEQWQGQASAASDQYALGVVLYELLTGEKPYTAETPLAVALKQMSEPLRRPRDLVESIPENVENLLYKTLAPNPEDRFESMSRFHGVLENLLWDLEKASPETMPYTTRLGFEDETIDHLGDVGSETKPVDNEVDPLQTIPKAPNSQTRRRFFSPWALLVGLGVLLVGLLCTGIGIVLLRNNLLDIEGEPTQVGVIIIESPTEFFTLTNIVTETPTNTLTPTSSATPTPSITPTEILTPSPTAYMSPTPAAYYPIAGCAASQLRLGDSAFVSYSGGRNRLRSEPDTHPSDNFIDEDAHPGEVLLIVGGPECNHGWILWEVETTRQIRGWTPETNGTDFFLLPLATRQLCEGAMPSRLVVGHNAMVKEEPPLANLLRFEPSKSSDQIGRIPPGDWMIVLDGPHCGNRETWWKVESVTTGVIGWTLEGENNVYYLAPEP